MMIVFGYEYNTNIKSVAILAQAMLWYAMLWYAMPASSGGWATGASILLTLVVGMLWYAMPASSGGWAMHLHTL